MKNYIRPLLIFLILALITVWSYGQSTAINEEQPGQHTAIDLISDDSEYISIQCASKENDSTDCYALIMPNSIECCCSSCKLRIEFHPSSNQNIRSKLNLSRVYSHFNNYVKRTYNELDCHVQQFKLSPKDDYEIIEILYTIGDAPEQFSVVYYATINKKGKKNKIQFLDCRGSCADDTQSCREIFSAENQQVECSCGGSDCVMIIEDVK